MMSDKDKENKVVVKIFGDEYPIYGVADPSHISRVADYVDSRMKETAKTGQVMSPDKVAILAAMSIASELHEAEESFKSQTLKSNPRFDMVLARLNAALATDH